MYANRGIFPRKTGECTFNCKARVQFGSLAVLNVEEKVVAHARKKFAASAAFRIQERGISFATALFVTPADVYIINCSFQQTFPLHFFLQRAFHDNLA